MCKGCREFYVPDAAELAALGLPRVPVGTQVARGRGCAACHGTGYHGRVAVRELGPRRIIYGSDVGGRGFASQLAKVRSAALSPADRRAILGGNLRAMLASILRAKGVAIEP